MEAVKKSYSEGRHTFKRLDEKRRTDDRLLVCPACGETLSPADVETFAKCPYCDAVLAQDLELEDFILEPLVDNWIRQQSIFLPIDYRFEGGPSGEAR
jgi:predicted Zn-ribbon and HTH transcriptional regulator